MRQLTGPHVIVTAAHNEERDLERTIQSVIGQTVLPLRYVIVSDGSADGTDEIAQRYAEQYEWIMFLRREKAEEEYKRVEKVSPGKVRAVELALRHVALLDFEYFANLDADVSFGPDYYERLLAEFAKDDRLGLAGGSVRNVLPDGKHAPDESLNPEIVEGPVQMFRWECYQEIGGYRPYGHEDSIANSAAKRKGWTVRSFADIRAWHHAPFEGYAPTIRSKVPRLFYFGMVDYITWTPVWFVVLAEVQRAFKRPYVLGAISHIAGYTWAFLSRKRKVPRETSYCEAHAEFSRTVLSKLRRVFLQHVSRNRDRMRSEPDRVWARPVHGPDV